MTIFYNTAQNLYGDYGNVLSVYPNGVTTIVEQLAKRGNDVIIVSNNYDKFSTTAKKESVKADVLGHVARVASISIVAESKVNKEIVGINTIKKSEKS